MFGLEKGIRFGFGYDIEATLKGLARVDETLADVAGAGAVGGSEDGRPTAAAFGAVPAPIPMDGTGRAGNDGAEPTGVERRRADPGEPTRRLAEPAPSDRRG